MPLAAELTFTRPTVPAGAKEVTGDCAWRQLRRCTDSVLVSLYLRACEVTGTVFKRATDNICYTVEAAARCYGPHAGSGTWHASCAACAPACCDPVYITINDNGTPFVTEWYYDAFDDLWYDASACGVTHYMELSGGTWTLYLDSNACGPSGTILMTATDVNGCPPTSGWSGTSGVTITSVSCTPPASCPTDCSACCLRFKVIVSGIGGTDGYRYNTTRYLDVLGTCAWGGVITTLSCSAGTWYMTWEDDEANCSITFVSSVTGGSCPPTTGWGFSAGNECHDLTFGGLSITVSCGDCPTSGCCSGDITATFDWSDCTDSGPAGATFEYQGNCTWFSDLGGGDPETTFATISCSADGTKWIMTYANSTQCAGVGFVWEKDRSPGETCPPEGTWTYVSGGHVGCCDDGDPGVTTDNA